MALAVIEANGGRALVRTSEAVEPREEGQKERTVVMEFESYAKALETYESEGYKEALRVLGSTAVRDFRIVEGV